MRLKWHLYCFCVDSEILSSFQLFPITTCQQANAVLLALKISIERQSFSQPFSQMGFLLLFLHSLASNQQLIIKMVARMYGGGLLFQCKIFLHLFLIKSWKLRPWKEFQEFSPVAYLEVLIWYDPEELKIFHLRNGPFVINYLQVFLYCNDF